MCGIAFKVTFMYLLPVLPRVIYVQPTLLKFLGLFWVDSPQFPHAP